MAIKRSRAKAQDSLLALGLRLTGDVVYSSNLYVYGTIDGNIEADENARHLVIGSSGIVTGTINAITLLVQGRVEGDIVCSDRLEVLSHGVVEGNITYAKIVLQEGAQITGKMMQRDGPLAIHGPQSTGMNAKRAAPQKMEKDEKGDEKDKATG